MLACAIAKQLGITKVIVNRFGSILSAYGLGLADEKEEETVLIFLHICASKSLGNVQSRLFPV